MANQLQFVVPNLAGLAALVTAAGFSAVVTDIAVGGTFIWNASNLSMQVTNNPGKGIFVPPSTDTTGASGAWVRQNTTVPGLTGINGGGLVNINALANPPFVTDGVTSNVPAFQSLAPILQGVNTEMPVPVNITVGSPTVLSLNPTAASGGTLPNPTIHFLKPNQAFYFTLSAGGALPAGISLNKLYYLKAGIQGVDGMTATTFTFSVVNNYGLQPVGGFTSEGSAVNTTGSLTGTLSIVLTGRYVSLFIPPGPYFGGNFGSGAANVNVTPNGMTRIRYFAYDASFDTKTSLGAVGGPTSCISDPRTWAITQYDLINTTPNDNNLPVNVDALITLQTTANAVNYYVGQWITIFGLNVQDPFGHGVSGPPNCQYQEFKQIKAINTGTGVLTLDGPLKWVYLSTFPQLFTPTSVFVAGGAASISPMSPSWDCAIEIYGARWVGEPTATCARRVLYSGCTSQGYANAAAQAAPGVCQSIVYRDHIFGPDDSPGATYMEIDKMLEHLEIERGYAPNKYRMQFTSPSLQVCNIKGLQGSAEILGTPRQIKVTDSVLNSMLVGPFIGVTDSCDLQNNVLPYFDMQARSDDPFDLLTNAVSLRPGNDMTLVGNWSFSNGIFTRNLTGLPGNQGLLWQIPGAKLYMIDAGGVYKTNQNMGSPFTILNVKLDGFGNLSFSTTLRAVPTRQTTTAAASVTNASPAVFTWTGSNLTAGTPIVFPYTATVPSPLLGSTVYYAANDGNLGANTFAVSDTLAHALAGTNQINTTASGSGITIFANPLCFRPHPCARFTSISNRGGARILSMNGAVDEPLFSRWNGAFVGKQQTSNPTGFQVPNPEVWGFLRSLSVNVRQAGVSSGTLNIGCPGFAQPNLGLSAFSQTIDTTVAGLRSWSGSAAPTGSAGADSISAYGDWIAGPLIFTPSAAVTMPNSPLVEIEVRTDQGITKYSNMIGAPGDPASGTFTWQYADSGIIQQFGSTP